MSVPTCSKCQRRHWNFSSCSEALRKAQGAGQPHIELRSDTGFRDFGNRLNNYEERGGVLWLKNPLPPKRGHVIEAEVPSGEEEA